MRRSVLHILLTMAAALLTAACANPGSGPDGGPYDETPPSIVGMSPALGTTGVKGKKVTITFDELIKVQNASEKVVVSPPQLEVPDIKTSGRRITVSLADTLRPSTTYTIDFSDAIEDLNEGNPLGNFTYYFSTGDVVDTMEVAGNVLAAENLEPVKGILVGLHSDTTDTAFTTKPFDRVARTDSRGRFVIKGVAPGSYRVCALKDLDGDFRLTRGEMLASLKTTVRPSSFPDVRPDTVWRDTVRYDSIRYVRFTHYTPDDLVLLAYTPAAKERYFLKSQRDVPEWFRIYFTAPSTRIPTVRGLNFNADSLLLEQRNAGNDTITYWLRDLSIPAVDTLRMVYTYDAFDDSLRINTEHSDTLELRPRQTMARRLKQKAEEMEKFQKQLERRHKRGDFSQETPPVTHLAVKVRTSQGASPMQNPAFVFTEPVVRIDTARIRLKLHADTSLVDAPFELESPPGPVLNVTLKGEWRYGQQYELLVDSAAIEGLSGQTCAASKTSLSFGKEDEFGALFVNLPGADTCTVVQLLSTDTKVERQLATTRGRADFFYLKPGTYYLRAFLDRNANGCWDTGDYERGIEPEAVYYFPGKIEVRANWDIDQTWHLTERPLTNQKPAALLKQKADEKKTVKHRNAERERERNKSK